MATSKEKRQDAQIKALQEEVLKLRELLEFAIANSDEVRRQQINDAYEEFKRKQGEIPKQGPNAIIVAEDEAHPNAIVNLDGSKSVDTDGEIVSYKWEDDQEKININEPTKAVTNFLMVSDLEKVTVKLTVTDNEGNTDTATKDILVFVPPDPKCGENAHFDKKLGKCVCNEGFEDDGTGKCVPIKDDSATVNVSEKWATGDEVDIMKGTQHKDGAGDNDGWVFEADPRLYASHAGGGDSANRSIIMSADGILKITGDMARAYDMVPNYNCIWELEFGHTGSWKGKKFASANMSFKARNRHQMGGANNNKIGGVGLHIGEDYIGSDYELQHGTNGEILKEKKLPQKIIAGNSYKLKWIIKDVEGKENTLFQEAWIDFGDGKGFVLCLSGEAKIPAPLFQKTLIEKESGIWYRNNGAGGLFVGPKVKVTRTP